MIHRHMAICPNSKSFSVHDKQGNSLVDIAEIEAFLNQPLSSRKNLVGTFLNKMPWCKKGGNSTLVRDEREMALTALVRIPGEGQSRLSSRSSGKFACPATIS